MKFSWNCFSQICNLNYGYVQFVDEKVQWMHIDLAGPVYSDKKRSATGFGVATLVEWVVKNSS